jgi:hypothetical protein
MNIILNNGKTLKTNLYVCSFSILNEHHHLNSPNTNLSCVQNIHCIQASEFSTVCYSLTNALFKVALISHLNTYLCYCRWILCVKVNHNIKCFYILHYNNCIFFACIVYLYVNDMFNTLLSFWWTVDPWNVCACLYICMYIHRIYDCVCAHAGACMHVCMWFFMSGIVCLLVYCVVY